MRAALAALGLAGCLAPAEALELKSPDGKVEVGFELKTVGEIADCPIYKIGFQGRPVLGDSALGLDLTEGPLLGNFEIAGQTRRTADTTWKPVGGEREIVRDHFNEVVIDLKQTAPPQRRLQLTFRAYNEGVAFCYTLPAQPDLTDFTLMQEATRFAFTADHTAWAVYSAQGSYDPADLRRGGTNPARGPVLLSRLQPGVERPLTVEVAKGIYAAVTEARLVDHARMKLRPAGSNTLQASLDGEVTGRAPFATPWRVILLADSPGKLLEQNDLIQNLNDPCAIANTSWIKPGKIIREITLTTAGGKACVEFALKHGLQFIEYDAGWYGHEYDAKSDARAVNLDPKRNPDPDSLDLRAVIDHANSKGIGVILYVNRLALEKQLDELLPLYRSWGVKGVKFGFVSVGDQRSTAWLHEAIRKAAEHQLMVDIHDEFRSTGYERTYPNLMTVEGIYGNEEFPTPLHNAALPFTRFLTGRADYTFCLNSPKLKVSRAHQLALSTIYFSPWQFLFWYDKPSDIADEPALDYWKHLPTTWDETRVIHGEIGRRAVIARRKGGEWFLGAISPGDGKFDIPLAFLDPGKPFTATIHSDAPGDLKAVRIEKRAVTHQTVLEADMRPDGGMAVHFIPTPH